MDVNRLVKNDMHTLWFYSDYERLIASVLCFMSQMVYLIDN